MAITYRFSMPTEPLPALLPQVYLLAARCKSPDVLVTVGDHLRRRRLERKLLQKDLAKAIGVGVPTITNWQFGSSQPEFRHLPKIIKFLGYDPAPQADMPRYRAKAQAGSGLKERPLELAGERQRFGYERLHLPVRREGWKVNHKRVLRLYRQERLALRRRKRKLYGSCAPPPHALNPPPTKHNPATLTL